MVLAELRGRDRGAAPRLGAASRAGTTRSCSRRPAAARRSRRFCGASIGSPRPRRPPTPRTGTRVVYVSPIKALAYDVERNLRAPLAGLQRLGAGAAITVDVRTGDTPRQGARAPAQGSRPDPDHDARVAVPAARRPRARAAARRRHDHRRRDPRARADQARHPPRAHARAPQPPRHLERRTRAAAHRPVGDPASTYRSRSISGRGPSGRDCRCERAARRSTSGSMVPAPDMENPGTRADDGRRHVAADLSAPARPDSRAPLDDRVRQLAAARRARQPAAHRARGRARHRQDGVELVRAHHGSVARHQRQEIEEALKAGRLRAITATSSLELGIDMGAVDLVLQVESPGAVSRGLQRIGRAGHHVGGTSIGRILPKFRGDLLEATVVAQQDARRPGRGDPRARQRARRARAADRRDGRRRSVAGRRPRARWCAARRAIASSRMRRSSACSTCSPAAIRATSSPSCARA